MNYTAFLRWICYTQNHMKVNIEDIKQKALPILKEAGVTRSSLFGSYVRGEQREDSDIDMLVDLPEGLSLFDIVEIKYKLEDALGKKVDLVQYDTIKPRLREYILSEQVPILDSLSVRDLAILVGVSESGVSHQLRELKDKHLVKAKRDKNTMYYSTAYEHLQNLLKEAEYYADHVKHDIPDHPKEK